MTSIYVDDRYRGAHGIGRYAREVLPRLRPHWRPLGLDGDPYRPLDAFRALPVGDRAAVVYSPGYGALVRAPRQLLTMHDLIQLRMPWPGRAKFVAYYSGPVRQVVRRAGVVLTVSETSARAVREWVGDDSVRVVNAGNGCSAAFTPQGAPARMDEPYVLFVGNTRKHKNLDVALSALIEAREARLVAVVPASEVDAVESRASALAVNGRVTVLHSIDDARLAAFYRGAAATVMPSTLEGFGLPALESVSCGVPVIYWRGCEAVAEIVGDRGWVIDSAQDAAPWAAAFSEAIADIRRVDAPLADAYSWEHTAALVSDELERLSE